MQNSHKKRAEPILRPSNPSPFKIFKSSACSCHSSIIQCHPFIICFWDDIHKVQVSDICAPPELASADSWFPAAPETHDFCLGTRDGFACEVLFQKLGLPWKGWSLADLRWFEHAHVAHTQIAWSPTRTSLRICEHAQKRCLEKQMTSNYLNDSTQSLISSVPWAQHH